MKRLVWIIAVLLSLATSNAVAAPGDLDETFSRDGLVTGASAQAAVDLVVADDDSILVAANGDRGELHRFAPSGEAIATFTSGAVEQIGAIDVRQAGQIVVGGGAAISADFLVAELGPDGTPACAGTGLCVVQTDFAGGADRLRDVVVAPDGSTVAVGTVTGPAGNQLGVARYLPDGTLDASFSGDGKLIIDTGGASSFAKNAVAHILADGSILLAGAGPGPDGSGRGDLLLAKIEPDGDLDPTFGGGDGFVTVNIDGRDDAMSIGVIPGGRILVGINACAFGLTTDCLPALARFTPTGELDPSFGPSGLIWPAVGAEVLVRSDGSFYAAGSTRLREHFQTDFAIGRYTADGSLHPSFSGDGAATADFDLGQDTAAVVAGTEDGRPVIGGTTFAKQPFLGLARFEIADGPSDADADGRLDLADRCPERYGAPATGCPLIHRSLTLKIVRGGRLRARLTSDLDSCMVRQPVRLQVRKSGRWGTVLRGRTGSRASFVSKRPLPDGKYRATVKATVSAPLGRCAKDVSKLASVD